MRVEYNVLSRVVFYSYLYHTRAHYYVLLGESAVVTGIIGDNYYSNNFFFFNTGIWADMTFYRYSIHKKKKPTDIVK